MAHNPTPGNAPMAPANPVAPAVYNPPRAPEVYTLADNVDAAIPKEVRDEFQRDEQGRILFFTAPPLNRPNKGVTEEFANLGHSVNHMAGDIQKLREERRAKKKERDEQMAILEGLATKKAREWKAKREQEHIKAQLKHYEIIGEAWLNNWVKEMDEGTMAIMEASGAIYHSTKEQKLAVKNMTQEQRDAHFKRRADDTLYEYGMMTAEQKKKYEETYLNPKKTEASDTVNGNVGEGQP